MVYICRSETHWIQPLTHCCSRLHLSAEKLQATGSHAITITTQTVVGLTADVESEKEWQRPSTQPASKEVRDATVG